MLEILHLEDVVFTLDALHAQKKTTQLIIESGNDYVIAVKGNQAKLLQEIKRQAEIDAPISRFSYTDTSKGRVVSREIKVFNDLSNIQSEWTGVTSLVTVKSKGFRSGKFFEEVRYYISSLDVSAKCFGKGIRGHWNIENRLHWVKDVVFKEDSAPFTDYNAATNWSLTRNIIINIARKNGYSSLTKAFRFIAHDLDKILSFLQ